MATVVCFKMVLKANGSDDIVTVTCVKDLTRQRHSIYRTWLARCATSQHVLTLCNIVNL